MKKKTMLMAVYNPIEVDGRVKRIATSFAEEYNLHMLCLRGKGEYFSPSFRVTRVACSSRMGRISRLLYFWWRLILRAWQTRPDVVYVHDFFLPFPGWLAARVMSATLVYDAHELSVPAKGDRHSVKERFFYYLECFVLPKAELVIAANTERAAVMKNHYKLQHGPTVVRNIPPMPVSQLNNEKVYRLYPGLRREDAGDVHFVYMGDINLARGLKVLLDSAALLPERFKFVFVGGGPDLGYLKELADENMTNRLRVIGPIPHDHVFDAIRQADIGFVSYAMSGLNNILCAPNKVFEYAQAGLPMVATCQPTIAALFAEHRVGELVGCDGSITPQAIAEKIALVAASTKEYKQQINGFLQTHTWQQESHTLLNAVNEVTL